MFPKSLALAALLVSVPLHLRAFDDIASYLETTTFLVARVNLKKVDSTAIFSFLQQQWPDSAQEKLLPMRAMSAAYLQALRDAKVDTIFITLSTIDCLKGELAVLLPCPEPDKLTPLLESILPHVPANMQMGIHKRPNLVVVASKTTWERLSAKPSAVQSFQGVSGETTTHVFGQRRFAQSVQGKLSAGLASQSSRAIAVALSFSDTLRGEVAEIWPEKLPVQANFEASPKSLMTDIRSVSLGLDLPPTPSALLIAAATDAEAATRVREILSRAAALVPKSELTVTANASNALVEISTEKLARLINMIASPLSFTRSQMQDSNNLKQIMLGMHNFHAKHEYLPPRETRSPDGKLLLSWRVFLLPFVDQMDLYKQFHLDEPWDSPHNRPLADEMPDVYRVGGFTDLAAGHTCVQLPIMPGGAWFGEAPPKRLQDITDGTSNTVAVVVAQRDKAVLWTKPEELSLRPDHVVQELFGDRDSLLFAYFDGSIRSHKKDVTQPTLKAMITSAGGEVIDSR